MKTHADWLKANGYPEDMCCNCCGSGYFGQGTDCRTCNGTVKAGVEYNRTHPKVKP